MVQQTETTILWPYLLAIGFLTIALLALAVWLWILKRQNQLMQIKVNAYEEMRQKCETYKKLAVELKPATDMVNGLRYDLNEAIKTDRPLTQVAKYLQERIGNSSTKTALDRIAFLSSDADLALKNLTLIKQLQQKISAFIDGDLQQQEPPGDQFTQRANRSKFISLAMMAFDVVESIDNPLASTKRQGINVKLMTGELLPEEARLQAEMTNEVLRNQSSPWARALQSALRTGMDLDTDQILLMRGQLFQAYQTV